MIRSCERKSMLKNGSLANNCVTHNQNLQNPCLYSSMLSEQAF